MAKFSPYRMSKKFERTLLAALGVLLMVAFALPSGDGCRRATVWGGRDPSAVMLTMPGASFTYGEAAELASRHRRAFRVEIDQQTAALMLAYLHEAERVGVYVSNDAVRDHIHNGRFPRRARAEWAIARSSDFGDSDGAKTAIRDLRAAVGEVTGPRYEDALKRLCADTNIAFGQCARYVSSATVKNEIREIAEAPDIVSRIFSAPIGDCSEPLPLQDGWCLIRPIERTSGFGPDGRYYPAEEGWIRDGFGLRSNKAYKNLLRDRNISQTDLERAVREYLVLPTFRYDRGELRIVLPGMPGNLAYASMLQLPNATFEAIQSRERTQAVPAWFGVQASDFVDNVTFTEDELRVFYTERLQVLRTQDRPGYLQPERVQIELVLARAEEDALLRAGGILSTLALTAGERAREGEDPDFEGLANDGNARMPGVFTRIIPPPFSAEDADRVVRDLAGAEPKLSKELFGEGSARYLLPEAEDKSRGQSISAVYPCEAGQFFFRVLKRQPAHAIPFADITRDIRSQLENDVRQDKAFGKAHEMAIAYRAAIHRAAFDAFAEAAGVEPVESPGFLTTDAPLPGIDKAVPAVYDAFVAAEDGELSSIIPVDDQYVLAYLLERKPDEGMKIRLVALSEKVMKGSVQPALYEQMARYGDSPYDFLDKPEPIPFEKVKDDIRALLARRAGQDAARDRADAARREAAVAEKLDLDALATKHKLAVHRDVKVDLAKTEAAEHVGKAAGFQDAVTDPDLKPGGISPVLASVEGRFFFVLRSRDEKSAAIDVVAVLFAEASKEAEVEDAAIRKYYDDHRDTAFVTKDEIADAPAWEDVSNAVRSRVKKALEEETAKAPIADRLRRFRTSAVLEAFRTVPTTTPLRKKRSLRFNIRRNVKVDLASPEAPFDEKTVLDAIKTLEPGNVSDPVPTIRGAVIAYVVSDEPEGTLTIDYVNVVSTQLVIYDEEISDADLLAHYEANKESYRTSDQLKVEMLAVSYEAMDKDIVKAKEKAKALLTAAADALRKQGAKADLKAHAKAHPPLKVIETPFFTRDHRRFETVDTSFDLAEKAFAAKTGDIVGPVLDGTDGACVLRPLERKPGKVPPFAEVRFRVTLDLQKVRAAARAVETAKTLHARIQKEIGQAADTRTAFKNAIEAQPLEVDLPYPARVTLSDPIYPLQVDYRRNTRITGLGVQPDLSRALFLTSPGRLTPVIDDPKQTTCYVALLTRFIAPGKPGPADMYRTWQAFNQLAPSVARASWHEYVRVQIRTPQ